MVYRDFKQVVIADTLADKDRHLPDHVEIVAEDQVEDILPPRRFQTTVFHVKFIHVLNQKFSLLLVACFSSSLWAHLVSIPIFPINKGEIVIANLENVRQFWIFFHRFVNSIFHISESFAEFFKAAVGGSVHADKDCFQRFNLQN